MLSDDQTRDPIATAAHLFGPRTAYAIVATLFVLAAFGLGADWLGAQIIGLPIGMWLVGLGLAVIHFRDRLVTGWERAGEVVRDSFDLETTTHEASEWRPARRAVRASSKRHRPLRIGFDLTRAEAAAIFSESVDSHGVPSEIEWVRIGGSDRGRFDAIISRDDGGIATIVVPQHSDHEPGWPDWGCPLPLTYAGVFPARMDPTRVTLEGVDLEATEEAGLVARLVVAAAHFGRMHEANGARSEPDSRSADQAMLDVVDQLLRVRDEGTLHENTVSRAAARVTSAWLTSADRRLTPGHRRCVLELCRDLLPDEPGASLRLAAGQFAAYADRDGMETLIEARNQLADAFADRPFDPLAFVFSEIQTGVESQLTLGRVAAGLCLVWATTPESKLSHVREDLEDEFRYAGWLIGRDQDHRLLLEVATRLDEARETRDTLWAVAA